MAPAATFRRLTAVLPDVAKGGLRQSGVIRNWSKGGNDRPGAGFARNDGKCAFKAPSFPVQSRALRDSLR
jgi:hypothetical protein